MTFTGCITMSNLYMRKKTLDFNFACFLQLRRLLMNNYKLELSEYKEPKMSGNYQ